MRTNAPRARRLRLLEATLLASVALFLLLGGLLAVLARPAPAGAPLDLNRDPAERIAPRLKTSAARLRAVQGSLGDVDQLGRARRGAAPIVDPDILREHRAEFVVRPPAEPRLKLLGALASLIVLGALGHLLVRRFRPFADPVFLPCALFLGGMGVLALYGVKDPDRDRLAFVAQTQGLWLAAAAACLTGSIALWKRPLHRYGYVYALGAVALLAALALFGGGPGGVRLAILGFQPVELVKVLLVLFGAAYLADRGSAFSGAARLDTRDLVPVASLYALPLALFALLRDLGPALLLFGAFVAILFAATNRRRYLLLGGVTVLLFGAVAWLLQIGTVPVRVGMWLSPWDNAFRGGDQVASALWSLGSGGLLGSGIGLGEAGRVPRAGSDMVLASVGCDMGLLATLLTLAASGAIVWRTLRVSAGADTDFRRLLGAGLAVLTGGQTLLIVAGTLGLFPLSGVSLSWVAYGKSAVVAQGLILGLLLAISDQEFPATPARASHIALRRLSLGFAAVTVLCVARLVQVQGFDADRTAVRVARVRDADGVRRPHRNPRLDALARAIPRGSLLDRNRKPLARTTTDGRRLYPLGAAAAHIVGWLDPRFGGPTHAERQFDTVLRGHDGGVGLLRLWRAKDLPGFSLPRGQDVTLTIDAGMQQRAYDALVETARQTRNRRTGLPNRAGAFVAVDPATGAVLAAASAPSFDPNTLTPERFDRLQSDPARPLVFRAVDGRYPPGSTFKAVTAAALLEAGRGDASIVCRHVETGLKWTSGSRTLSRRRVVDDESEQPHGQVGLDDAVRVSCNVFFARSALGLGAEPLRATGLALGIPLPDVATLTDALPEASFGQGPVVASPLQIATAFAAIGAGGQRREPRWRADEATGTEVAAVSPETARRLSSALASVAVSGTAAGRFAGLPFAVAGKTGTAQTESGDGRSHSWFAGFAPATSPRIAFAAIVENGGYGAAAAVPLVRRFLESGIGN